MLNPKHSHKDYPSKQRSAGGYQWPLFQEKSIHHHNGSNLHAWSLSFPTHPRPSRPGQP